MNYVYIGLGGAIGSILRFFIISKLYNKTITLTDLPVGTILVNILGCFIIGLLLPFLISPNSENSIIRNGLAIGVLGGFTTFSAFSFETIQFIISGRIATAISNVLISLVCCLLATWVGTVLSKSLF